MLRKCALFRVIFDAQWCDVTYIGDSDALSIEIRQVPPETLEHVITYLKHHKGKEPDPLPCPVRSIHMAQIVSDKWDANWIDAFDKKTIFEIILAANYMGMSLHCRIFWKFLTLLFG